ncbi:MAG: hypothetical protein KDE09_08535 [Anaerolineales bacterium]|nr:hypothetical protein [Anaerolineales bacterium]MCB8962776.1 hypothetical protein [Ardenticatenales bacterium]MCB0005293.1 hypothetical protein [Anaerolineales bacterium]MCB0010895.1 hypothetical protein [Anaerolineales bacterium]MCB0017823.1 hypothetical protein [Anaerolineales bacterium]
MEKKKSWLNKAAVALVLLFSGFAMLPFAKLSAEALNWQLFGGIYEPDLTVVDNVGAPGSAFHFQAANYPPNALATVYVDGLEVGTLTTDGNGQAEFLIWTEPTDPNGSYDVTMSTDANTSDTASFTLSGGQPVVPPPPNFTGSNFTIDGSLPFSQNLPIIRSE